MKGIPHSALRTSVTIMHVDIDAFFASVEQVRNPHLRGKPVIVGSGVIASCSYEARRYGLSAGMPLYKARRLCPKVVILKGHYPTYRCFAERIFEICREIAPGVEEHLDEAYCDLSGTGGLYGHPCRAGKMLKDRVRERAGLSVSVGIAANRMMAKIAGNASKPDGLAVVEPGEEDAFVRNLPVEKLPGVGYATRRTLAQLNVRTVDELRRLSCSMLQQLFGANGRLLYERCRGRDTRALDEREIPQSISRETTFHQETVDLKEIEAMLFYLVERAAGTLRGLGLKCGRVRTHLRYSDYQSAAVARTMPHGMSFDKDLFTLVKEQFDGLYTRRVSLRLIGVTLSRLSPAGAHQTDLFEQTRNDRLDSLYQCLDTLRDKFGHSVIVAGKSLDLLGKLRQDSHGYVLRTPCLTK